MGATNCPETPRQRMIGMMYLVLTAMLALNVSKDILEAFVVVNDAMEQTTTNFNSKVAESYLQFDQQELVEELKVKPFNDKAKQIRKISNEFVEYVEQVKYEMYADVDGITVEEARTKTLREMSAKDNYSKPTLYFIGQTYDKKAYEMHKKIDEYKANIKKIVGDSNFIIPPGLNTDVTSEKAPDWERHNFERTVAAASYTLLNKMIGEIRNMEFEVVKILFSAIDAKSHKFDNVGAKVIPNSRVVFSGDSYEADIIVAAYDSHQDPIIYWKSGIDTATAEMVDKLNPLQGEKGVVRLKIPTGGIGDQKFAGVIKLMGPSGDEYHSFKGSYTVTKPAAAVAAEKMNVFYVGIPNPVSIAAPVAPEKLRISWGGATATQLGGGRYDVNVPVSMAGREVTVTVSADMGGNKVQTMGSTTFRVKSVPEPTVFLGANILGGRQPKEIILANPLITARMSPDFNYELRWSIVSYRVTFVRNGVEESPIAVQGPHFPDRVKSMIQSAPSGTNMEITEIKISSIAGQKVVPNPIVVRIR